MYGMYILKKQQSVIHVEKLLLETINTAFCGEATVV